MVSNWVNEIIAIARTISEILTAGIAITAFALLLYSLTFNLLERVARTFATIMVCLVIVFSTESFGATSKDPYMIDFWLRAQWVGIILLPAAYLNFSDALLATTGRPSRWRRRWAIRATYLFSFILIFFLFTPWFLGELVLDQPPAPHHLPTIYTQLFIVYYIIILVLAWVNFRRAYQRTLTRTSKRRMLYLAISAIGPVVGAFPFLLYSSEFASQWTLLFWLLAATVSIGLDICIFIMAYAVAFFGVPWPDRVVKSRLIKWTLRGPITAVLTLGLMTLVKRANIALGTPYDAFVPLVMVVTVLICEYAITLFFPAFERWLIYDRDEQDLRFVLTLEQRIITRGDLKQFIEMVLAAVNDRAQAQGAYLLEKNDEGFTLVEKTPDFSFDPQLLEELDYLESAGNIHEEYVECRSDILIPLHNNSNGSGEHLLGYIGITGIKDISALAAEDQAALKRLAARAAIALRDRHMLEQVFDTLERLEPQEELIQKLRAVSRFDQRGMMMEADWMEKKEMTTWVKGALTHYWGGPKLTDSPLLKLEIVKEAMAKHDNNEVNALRTVLRSALEQLKPEGERKYTGEWLLYNILEMKFLEGKKVREIAVKLAVSEADLYRKQKVAIEKIADRLVQMELNTRNT